MGREISLGRKGEELALRFLEAEGLVLLERNWRWDHKEIDLIMESPRAIHFVEVKALRAPAAHEPWEAVTPLKQRYLSKAAEHFIFERRIGKEARFDEVSILFDGDDASIEYIPEAFYPVY
ncbi:MAG: YraN family protein [Bacteroidales bacterium]|nr:YraN family protein [Bacteroidales bacterium]